jgi:hypothetical protein
MCLLWLRHFGCLLGLESCAALVFVALGLVATGSVLLLRPKLSSSAQPLSGGVWVVVERFCSNNLLKGDYY